MTKFYSTDEINFNEARKILKKRDVSTLSALVSIITNSSFFYHYFEKNEDEFDKFMKFIYENFGTEGLLSFQAKSLFMQEMNDAIGEDIVRNKKEK